jgi:hypothetical protein
VRGAETAVAARLVRERESDTVAESPKEEEDTAPWWWEGKAAVETDMPWTARSAIGGGHGAVCWIGVDLGSEGDDGLDGIRREVINETGGHSWAWRFSC